MDILTIAKERYSVRKFSDRKIGEREAQLILEAGKAAPTACNRQPQRIFLLRSKEALEKWSRCTECHFGEQMVILTCYDKNESWKRVYDGEDSGFTDAAIVATHMMLEAWELGIGSTWVMYFIPEAVREEFSLPDHLVPASALVMGYAAPDASPSPRHSDRKPLSETVTEL